MLSDWLWLGAAMVWMLLVGFGVLTEEEAGWTLGALLALLILYLLLRLVPRG